MSDQLYNTYFLEALEHFGMLLCSIHEIFNKTQMKLVLMDIHTKMANDVRTINDDDYTSSYFSHPSYIIEGLYMPDRDRDFDGYDLSFNPDEFCVINLPSLDAFKRSRPTIQSSDDQSRND